jgi:RNA recognition motif-containing protein
MQIRLDRFTFFNNQYCFIELASEEQALNAVKDLEGSEFMHSKWRVAPLKEDFVWGETAKDSPRSFEVSLSEVLKPLFEGRRKMFCVQTPGWGKKNSSEGHNQVAKETIEKYFGKYGIEAISGLQPFHGDITEEPRMLCFLDFKSKDGADRAVQAFHDKEIDGRRVTLVNSILSPWRAHQVGKLDTALLAELQKQGLAAEKTYEDNFVNSDKVKGAKYHKKTRMQRKNMIKAEKVDTMKASAAT